MKANVGMRYAVASVISAYTPYSAITYGNGFVVSEARGANVTWDTDEGEFRGDDVVLDSSKRILGYSVEFETAGLKDGVRGTLLGETKDSNDAYHITGAEAPDVGFGYVKQMREDDNSGNVDTTWEVFWYYKLKFGQPTEDARTAEQNREWRVPTINGAGAGVFQSAGAEEPEYAEHKTFDTLAAAKAYLNGKANIS